MSDAGVEVDLLVIGGGMAGMSAAGYAARRGATVMVVEKGPDIGGSAVLSGGGLWAPSSVDGFCEVNPEGDPALIRVIVDGYGEVVEWVRSLGVTISDPVRMDGVQGYPCVGSMFDVLGYVQRCRAAVLDAGGWVLTGATVVSLQVEDGTVRGATVRDRDGEAVVRAPWTLLASGGFQNDADLRRRFIGEQAAAMLVRSNPNSAGDGLRLALSAGGTVSSSMDGWYGHTVPYPLPKGLHPPDYLSMAQFFLSPRSVLLDAEGCRFVDESAGYYLNAQAVSKLPTGRALMVADEQVRYEDATGQGIGTEHIDRPEEARKAGAHVVRAGSLEEIARAAAEWGYRGVETAVRAFNERVERDDHPLLPPRRIYRRPLTQPPWFAIEVQPAITFTFGGIRIDEHARVLDERGQPVPGLLAAGADAGGMYRSRYGGGLAMGCAFALQGVRVMLASSDAAAGSKRG
jgi:succinate dehydrogenase/fumarate reductase flavoprotein subunit